MEIKQGDWGLHQGLTTSGESILYDVHAGVEEGGKIACALMGSGHHRENRGVLPRGRIGHHAVESMAIFPRNPHVDRF